MSFDSSQVLLLAMAILGLFLVMRITRKRLSTRNEPPKNIRERYREMESPRGTTRDLEQVMGELDQLSRQIHGRLDTKLAKLEAVMRDADERIDRLARMVRATEGSPTLDITVADQLEDSAAMAAVAATAPAEKIPPGLKPDHNRATILQLADRGLSAAEIAESTGRNAGEVELILSLRKAERTAARKQ